MLFYLLIAFANPTGWQGSTVVHATPDPIKCEAMAQQLRQTGKRYECHTLVSAFKAVAP